jgi:N,N'-diacetyllegionaminate synthase
MLRKFELSLEQHKEIIEYCKKIKINYCASVFDISGLNFLINNKIKIVKIPSGEITNKFLLEELKKFKGLVLLSTGMSKAEEVNDAVKILRKNKNKFHLFYCCSSYPAPIEEIDMNILLTLKKIYKCPVGYSDHTKDNDAAILATLMGATFVEKHFTDNKKLSGPDHNASSDFKQLKQLTKKIKVFKLMLKSGIKIVTKSEVENIVNSRKSIVAKNLILKGEKFSKKNLIFKRPGNGISPMKINSLLGVKAKKNFLHDEQIKV